MSYYNDPSGYGSWWVPEGMSPEEALALQMQMNPSVEYGGEDAQLMTQPTLSPTMSSPDPYIQTEQQSYTTVPLNMSSPEPLPTGTTSQTETSPWMPTGTGNMLTLTNPQTGQTQTVDPGDYQTIDSLTRSGWMPAGYNNVTDYQGGQMFQNQSTGQWSPLNVVLGGSLTPEQQSAMTGFMESLGTTNTGTGTGGTGTSTYNPSTPGTYGLAGNFPEEASAIPSVNLPNPQLMSEAIPEAIRAQYVEFMNNLAGQAQQVYNYGIPQFNPAQLNLGEIPQPQAQQMQLSPEMIRMLAGEGYAPNIVAQMRSRASEQVAGAGATEMAAMRRALEQSGYSGSPAAGALQADVARRTGDATTSALRDIDIRNADVGMENFRSGVGYQSQIGLSNMQAANQMALANANMLFAGMTQNLNNQQEANASMFGAENTRLQNQANTTAGILGQQGNLLQSGAINRTNTAATQNQEAMNQWMTMQAQLERQRQLANQNAVESRWTTAATQLPSWTPTGGSSYTPTLGYNPFGG